MYSIHKFSIDVKPSRDETGVMKILPAHWGLYDTKQCRLIFRSNRLSRWDGPTVALEREINPNLVYVWVKYYPNGEQGLRVQLVRIFGGEILHDNYDLSETIQPRRFAVTPYGSQYLWVYGIHFNSGDTITPYLLKARLPLNNHVSIYQDKLLYGERVIAVEKRG